MPKVNILKQRELTLKKVLVVGLVLIQATNKYLAVFLSISYRDNILLDCVHGLLVVLISLLGFISVVWLRDQLGHGVGPNWLEEDRREVNRVIMREAQERVDLLRRHLEEAGVRARERHVVPDRVAVAAELSKLHDLLANESNQLSIILYKKFIIKLNDMWKREMELIYDLHGSSLACNDILQSARKKKYKRLQQWEIKKVDSVVYYFRDYYYLFFSFRVKKLCHTLLMNWG